MSAIVLPRGKGMWVRGPHAGRESQLAARLVRSGFEWASPIALWGAASVASAPRLNDALREAGIELYPTWGLPKPESWRQDVDPFFAHASAIGARGVIINAEQEWKGHPAEAAEFTEALRRECNERGLALLFASYSIPQGQPSFPWSAFALVSDMAIALTFDRDMNFDPAYAPRGIRQYQERGFRNVVAAASTWNKRDRRDKTAAELERHLALFPPQRTAILWNDGSVPAELWPVLADWNPENPRDAATLPALPAAQPPRGRSSSGRGGGLALAAAVGLALALARKVRR